MKKSVCSLIYLGTLVALIANNMNPDQTAPLGAVGLGFIVFASLVKFSVVYLNLCSRQRIKDKDKESK